MYYKLYLSFIFTVVTHSILQSTVAEKLYNHPIAGNVQQTNKYSDDLSPQSARRINVYSKYNPPEYASSSKKIETRKDDDTDDECPKCKKCKKCPPKSKGNLKYVPLPVYIDNTPPKSQMKMAVMDPTSDYDISDYLSNQMNQDYLMSMTTSMPMTMNKKMPKMKKMKTTTTTAAPCDDESTTTMKSKEKENMKKAMQIAQMIELLDKIHRK